MRDSRCVFSWVFFLALVAGSSMLAKAGDAVPVLIWGGGRAGDGGEANNGSPFSPVNPLLKTSQLEFERVVTGKLGGSQRPILVFVRDNLCVEDLTQHKEGLMHLKDDGSLVYLPAVESPLSVFESLASYNQSEEEELETVSEGQVVITKATDLDAVSETFNMVKESSPNLIAALIGKSCTYSSRPERVRRQAESTSSTTQAPNPEDPLPVIKTDRILMYYAENPILNVTQTETSTSELLEVSQQGEGDRESPLALNFVFSVKNTTSPYNASIILEFNMNSSSYYTGQAFYRDNDQQVKLTTISYFVFPYNVSYHCSSSVRFYQKKNEVKKGLEAQGIDFVISNFQVQVDPKFNNFSYPFDCVGFTSAPIWSGLFVTLILGLIMIWGLTMIMDIRTMDRFDDPKGKTITVTASE